MHKLLPLEARLMLQRAASVENTPDDPRSRQKAIERAMTVVQRDYPQYFREEAYADDDRGE